LPAVGIQYSDLTSGCDPLEGVRISFAPFPPVDMKTSPLLGRADRALYRVRDRGRDRVEMETLD